MSNELPSSAALPRFSVRPYTPDGGFTMGGVLMLAAAMVLAGAAMGFVAYYVSKLIYLILVFPVFIGFGMGAVGVAMVKAGRIRNALVGGATGFIGGALAMSMLHYFDYREFRTSQSQQHADVFKIAQLPRAEREKLLNDDQTVTAQERQKASLYLDAMNSLPGYMNWYAAEVGVRIKSTHASSKNDQGTNLGYIGSYIYWSIEILIVAGITFGMVRATTREPYCPRCDQWKLSKVLGLLQTDGKTAKAAVLSGDLSAIAAAHPVAGAGPGINVSASACPGCSGQTDVDVKVEQITKDKQNKIHKTTLAQVTYPAEALPLLAQLFIPKPAVATPPPLPAHG
jgi:hypothetical protein